MRDWRNYLAKSIEHPYPNAPEKAGLKLTRILTPGHYETQAIWENWQGVWLAASYKENPEFDRFAATTYGNGIHSDDARELLKALDKALGFKLLENRP